MRMMVAWVQLLGALHCDAAFQLQRMPLPILTHFFLTLRRREGFTPLHTAARHGDLSVVQLLVGEGANVNAVALEYSA